MDLATRPGQPVYAAGPGRVGLAGDLAGRGVVTVIHGGLRTTYLPVRPSVRAGRMVTAGARIGVVDDAPGHCGPSSCLHWGLLRGVSYLDPLTLLGLGHVRLLPWWTTRVPRDHDLAGPPLATPRGLRGTSPAVRAAGPGTHRREAGHAGPPDAPPMRPAGTAAAAGGTAATLITLACLLTFGRPARLWRRRSGCSLRRKRPVRASRSPP